MAGKQIGTVVAKDAVGTSYTLNVIADEAFFDAPDRGDLTRRESRPTYRLEMQNGDGVNYQAKGRYWLVSPSGNVVNLTTDDPNAP